MRLLTVASIRSAASYRLRNIEVLGAGLPTTRANLVSSGGICRYFVFTHLQNPLNRTPKAAAVKPGCFFSVPTECTNQKLSFSFMDFAEAASTCGRLLGDLLARGTAF